MSSYAFCQKVKFYFSLSMTRIYFNFTHFIFFLQSRQKCTWLSAKNVKRVVFRQYFFTWYYCALYSHLLLNIKSWRFLSKYGHESIDFFREKSEKKRHPIDFFHPSYSEVLENFRFFGHMGMNSRGFFMKKIEIKWHESIVILREWIFFRQNMGMRASCF